MTSRVTEVAYFIKAMEKEILNIMQTNSDSEERYWSNDNEFVKYNHFIQLV